MEDRKATAYHEAGHFVALHVLLPTSYELEITIRPGEGFLGRVLHEGWESWLGPGMTEKQTAAMIEAMRHQVVMAFAGYAAQRLVDPEADQRGSASDDECAREILALLEEESLESEYRQRTAEFVLEHRAAIEAVAGELLEHESLDPSEAATIMDIAMGEGTEEDLARYRSLMASARLREAGQ